MGAIGDRDGDSDPPFVKIKKSMFEWREVHPVFETDDGSAILKWFEIEENCLVPFDAAAEP